MQIYIYPALNPQFKGMSREFRVPNLGTLLCVRRFTHSLGGVLLEVTSDF